MTIWSAGEEAVCINAGPCRCCGCEMPFEKGRVYVVAEAYRGVNKRLGLKTVFLRMEGVSAAVPGSRHQKARGGVAADRFRKVKRDRAEGEAKDWRLLLDSMKPKVDA